MKKTEDTTTIRVECKARKILRDFAKKKGINMTQAISRCIVRAASERPDFFLPEIINE